MREEYTKTEQKKKKEWTGFVIKQTGGNGEYW
jgi:hypothetical protein